MDHFLLRAKKRKNIITTPFLGPLMSSGEAKDFLEIEFMYVCTSFQIEKINVQKVQIA